MKLQLCREQLSQVGDILPLIEVHRVYCTGTTVLYVHLLSHINTFIQTKGSSIMCI